MRRFAAAAVLVLAACGGEPPRDDASPTTPEVPSLAPNAAQDDALARKLHDIVPAAPRLHHGATERIVKSAHAVCVAYIQGSPNLVASTKAQFASSLRVDKITDEQAQQMIDVIKAEPWCKK